MPGDLANRSSSRSTPGLGLDDRPPAAGRRPSPGCSRGTSSVMHDFVGERLHHGVWANSIDGRGGDLRYRWSEDAVALGAVPGSAVGMSSSWAISRLCATAVPSTSTLPDRVGMPVLHRISIEHGALGALGDNRDDCRACPRSTRGGSASRRRSPDHRSRRVGEDEGPDRESPAAC